MTSTVTPDAPIDCVVIEIVETGSVIVWPTSSEASLSDGVPGVVSRSSVATGDQVGLAEPQPRRTVTPFTTGEPAENASKTPCGVRRSRSK